MTPVDAVVFVMAAFLGGLMVGVFLRVIAGRG